MNSKIKYRLYTFIGHLPLIILYVGAFVLIWLISPAAFLTIVALVLLMFLCYKWFMFWERKANKEFYKF